MHEEAKSEKERKTKERKKKERKRKEQSGHGKSSKCCNPRGKIKATSRQERTKKRRRRRRRRFRRRKKEEEEEEEEEEERKKERKKEGRKEGRKEEEEDEKQNKRCKGSTCPPKPTQPRDRPPGAPRPPCGGGRTRAACGHPGPGTARPGRARVPNTFGSLRYDAIHGREED